MNLAGGFVGILHVIGGAAAAAADPGFLHLAGVRFAVGDDGDGDGDHHEERDADAQEYEADDAGDDY